ncbi:hypothetical protein ZIOFF_049464 [Zingiber officinale]|uniref:Phospholipid/glycerol acyltransferase domain-containing protein n=1 Tax=Zingiber officinale TaxID=94328 RepID=A0A8J5FSY4_ZINOF|nr:hypothetical protein ZIOFF_049464 [Zingiber officinale]
MRGFSVYTAAALFHSNQIKSLYSSSHHAIDGSLQLPRSLGILPMASADLAGGGGSEADSSHFVPGDGGASATPKDDQPLLESDSSPASVVAAAVPISPEELERKYAPYVRRDAYGVMGLGQLPATEKVMLGIAAVTLVPIRVVAGVLILVLYYLICRMCTLFSPPSRENGQEDYAHMTGWRRAVVVRCGRFASRAMLFTFGFYWIKETRLSLDNEVNEFEKPGAVVSNHISYVDILYHMSSAFPSFVAKRSVAQLPLVGLISAMILDSAIVPNHACENGRNDDALFAASALVVSMFNESPSRLILKGFQVCSFANLINYTVLEFATTARSLNTEDPKKAILTALGSTVQKNIKFSLKRQDYGILSTLICIVTERIQKAHKDSLCPMMLLFPEGTTTNGDYLLPFKSGAFLAKAPVVPVILKYPYGRFSPAWDSISGTLATQLPLLSRNQDCLVLLNATILFASSVRHVCLLLCQFVNHLEVIHLPVYYPSDQEKEDPKLYAGNVRKLMATEGNLTLSDIGLAEKRIYHAVLNGNSLPRVLREKGD